MFLPGHRGEQRCLGATSCSGCKRPGEVGEVRFEEHILLISPLLPLSAQPFEPGSSPRSSWPGSPGCPSTERRALSPGRDNSACQPQGWLLRTQRLPRGCGFGSGVSAASSRPLLGLHRGRGPWQHPGAARDHGGSFPRDTGGSISPSLLPPCPALPAPAHSIESLQQRSAAAERRSAGTRDAGSVSNHFIATGATGQTQFQRGSGSSPLTSLILLRRRTPSLHAHTRVLSILHPGPHGAAPEASLPPCCLHLRELGASRVN